MFLSPDSTVDRGESPDRTEGVTHGRGVSISSMPSAWAIRSTCLSGQPDPAILIWAEREARVLVTNDKKSMLGHFLGHIQSGYHSPGIFIIGSQSAIPRLVSFLASIANTSEPSEWAGLITFIP